MPDDVKIASQLWRYTRSLFRSVQRVSTGASTSFAVNEDHVLLNGAAGVRDVTLPDAATYLGRRVQVTAIDITNACSVTRAGTDTIKIAGIGSMNSYTFLAQWESLTLEAVFDGTNYYWLVV